jgi:hypothetical protein
MLLIVLLRVLKATITIPPYSIITINLVPGIRDRSIELLLYLNAALKFKDIEYKETCLPDLSV